MEKKVQSLMVLAFAVVLALGLTLGCGGAKKEPETQVKESSAPIEVPFAKLVQPAFADEYAKKVVKFDAVFMGTQPSVMDLPNQYKNGFLRIMLSAPGNPSATSMNVVVPKSNDVVFNLQPMANITVVAKTIMSSQVSGITGAGQKNLIFEVQSITPKQ